MKKLLLFALLLFTMFTTSAQELTKHQYDSLKTRIYHYMISANIHHPDIVMKQILLETNRFKSDIYLENNNLLGMKVPKSRPTLAIGENRGHAVYHSWEMCIIDLQIYQKEYLRDGEDYYDFLVRMKYATSPTYIQTLKSIKN